MCLKQKVLVQSHFVPRALYDYCRSADSEPIKFSNKIALTTSYQAKDYLLCAECESVLNEGGEKWTVGKLAQMGRQHFPLYEIVTRAAPAYDEPDAKIYYGIDVPGLEIDKVIHFMAGILWKASVHSWKKDKKEPWIELGPYSDKLRKYLLGEEAFPQHITLWMSIVPPEKAMIGFIEPHERISEGGWKTYFCYMPGVLLAWNIGRQVSVELRQGCFATNAYHPFLISNNVHERLEEITKKTYLGARKTKKLLEIKARRAAHMAVMTS